MKWFDTIKGFFWVSAPEEPTPVEKQVVVKAKTPRRKIKKEEPVSGEFDERAATKMIMEAVNVKNSKRTQSKK